MLLSVTILKFQMRYGIVHEGSLWQHGPGELAYRTTMWMLALSIKPLPPVGEAWAEWELIVREDDIVNIKSRRYGGYLDSWQHKEVKVTDGNPAEKLRHAQVSVTPQLDAPPKFTVTRFEIEKQNRILKFKNLKIKQICN